MRDPLFAPSVTPPLSALPSVPGYEILGVLGRGGMGVVYHARQIALNRPVALKMVLAGLHAAPEDVARFQIEAEAVARLQHVNIVQVYDTGSNASQTTTGTILGTPSYMAPEQAEGRTRAIGPATDIYGLGTILYEMLSGRPPFPGDNVQETLDLVRYQEPLRPSQLYLEVPRDLETICLRCLHKEPERRYPSAEALADDLSAFLAGEPIRSRRAGPLERLMRWAWVEGLGVGRGVIQRSCSPAR